MNPRERWRYEKNDEKNLDTGFDRDAGAVWAERCGAAEWIVQPTDPGCFSEGGKRIGAIHYQNGRRLEASERQPNISSSPFDDEKSV